MNNYNIAQPTRLADDIVLISAGYGTGAEAFRIIQKIVTYEPSLCGRVNP